MATWTQDEIDQVRAAIIALAAGKRTVSISYAGPPARSETYQAADLADLRALHAQMESTSSGKQGYRLVSTSKGV